MNKLQMSLSVLKMITWDTIQLNVCLKKKGFSIKIKTIILITDQEHIQVQDSKSKLLSASHANHEMTLHQVQNSGEI